MRHRSLLAAVLSVSLCCAVVASSPAAPPKAKAKSASVITRKVVLNHIAPGEAVRVLGATRGLPDTIPGGRRTALPPDAISLEVQSLEKAVVLRGPAQDVEEIVQALSLLDVPTRKIQMRVRLLRAPYSLEGIGDKVEAEAIAEQTVTARNGEAVEVQLMAPTDTWKVRLIPHKQKGESVTVSGYASPEALPASDPKATMTDIFSRPPAVKWTARTTMNAPARTQIYVEPRILEPTDSVAPVTGEPKPTTEAKEASATDETPRYVQFLEITPIAL